MLRRPEDLAYVLAHLPELVVKEVHGAGGYGMLIGPAATKAEIEDFRHRILAAPERYIAQPTLALSTMPHLFGPGDQAPSHRPAPLRALGPGHHHRSRRAHAGRAARRLAGGQLLPGRRHQGHLGAGRLTMLSRTADHLYWMSRYIERAESLARIWWMRITACRCCRTTTPTLARVLEPTMTGAAHGRGVPRASRRHRAARGVRVREPGPGVSRQHLQLPAGGARERPRGARLAHLGIVGDAEFHLARCPLPRLRAPRRTPTSANSSNGSRNARTSRAA